MKTQHSKQAIIKFITKHTFYYIQERCEECVSRFDFREQLGFNFINYDYSSSGLREIIITFDLEDVDHFMTMFRKSKIFKEMISMKFKNNKPLYDKVLEYHTPCHSVDIFRQPKEHERHDNKISFIHKRIKYNIYYCDVCLEGISNLSYQYSYETRLLHFIVNESGLFDMQKGDLYWHRQADSYDNPCKESKVDYDFEEIYSTSFNKYYIRTPKYF